MTDFDVVNLAGLVSLISCVLGLVFCTRSGNYFLEIFDGYAGSIPLLIIAFCEIVTVAWVYGTRRFDEDVSWMYGGPKSVGGWILHWYFRLCWTFISPAVILTVFVAYIYTTATSTLTYDAWVDVSLNRFPPAAMNDTIFQYCSALPALRRAFRVFHISMYVRCFEPATY